LGVSVFDLDDARKAGTKNLDKFPRNMLFARAMSNGAKWFTPDVCGGLTVYVPEELGAEVDEDGHVVDVTPVDTEYHENPASDTQAPLSPASEPQPPKKQFKSNRPFSPEQMKDAWQTMVSYATRMDLPVSDSDRNMIAVNLEKCLLDADDPTATRHMVTKFLTGKESVKELTIAEVAAMKRWLDAQQDSGGEWVPNHLAQLEAVAILLEATK
jgi:hypothetical protein